MSPKQLAGTGVAIVTPFRSDGSLDFNSLQKLIDHLAAGKVEYLVVLGTTGESVTLSKDEKKALVSFVVEAVQGRLQVIVGIGGSNTQEVTDSISKQDFTGISGILSVSPYYNKPSQEGLYAHFKSVVTTSPVPVILYNVPGRTGINMSAETTLRLAKEFEQVVAIKEASGNLAQVMQIIGEKPEGFSVISGDDILTLPMLSLGATGAISVIANAWPFEYSEMVRLALKGNFAQSSVLHYKLFELMQALFEEGSPSGIKAALSVLGITGEHLRLPLVPVSSSLKARISKLSKAI